MFYHIKHSSISSEHICFYAHFYHMLVFLFCIFYAISQNLHKSIWIFNTAIECFLAQRQLHQCLHIQMSSCTSIYYCGTTLISDPQTKHYYMLIRQLDMCCSSWPECIILACKTHMAHSVFWASGSRLTTLLKTPAFKVSQLDQHHANINLCV